MSGRFFRVFFPSHVFVLMFLFLYLFAGIKRPIYSHFPYIIILLVTLVISYSRSLWLGLGIGVIIIAITALKRSKNKFRILFSLLIIATILLVVLTTNSGFDFITDRIASIFSPKTDVAGAHRIELGKAILTQAKTHPVFGTGFGTLITFPTILPNGEIIATAFYVYEWSYGDLLVKLGAVGLIAMLYLMGRIILSVRKQSNKANHQLATGSVIGIAALAVASITTPIFTHPLGFGLLALASSIILFTHENTNSNSDLES